MLKNSLTILLIALFLSIEFSSVSAESQIVPSDLTYVPTNESLIVKNIVIVIDSSGSTTNNDPTTHLTIIGLIDANAISILRVLGRCSYAGVVAFGGATRQIGMLSMGSEANRVELEKFIKEIGPQLKDNNPTDLDKGLQAAKESINTVTGTKEIIIISDGLIHPDGLSQTKNTINDLKKNNTNIQFIQILLSGMSQIPNDNYNALAKTAGTNVILLYPDERIKIISPSGIASNGNEPCISPTPAITPSPTITTVTPTPNPQLEQEVKDLKEQLKKTEEKLKQQETRISWLESMVNSIRGWIKSFF